jgi:hypothetical protein
MVECRGVGNEMLSFMFYFCYNFVLCGSRFWALKGGEMCGVLFSQHAMNEWIWMLKKVHFYNLVSTERNKEPFV